MKNEIYKTKANESENFDDYSTLTLPFVNPETVSESTQFSEEKKEEPLLFSPIKFTQESEEVKVLPNGFSPLNALKKKLRLHTAETGEEIVPNKRTEKEIEDIKPAETPLRPVLAEADSTKSESAEPPTIEPKSQKDRPSLLKRCMPYIYDEEGVSQVDNRPVYTLDSVEDIIRSAELRANEKIAEKYSLTDNTGNKIRLTAEAVTPPVQVKDEQQKPSAEKFSLPVAADILFDDFNGKRTVVEQGVKVVTPYSKLTSLQVGMGSYDEEKTAVMPPINSSRFDTMEDIVSHTRPVNIKDAPGITATRPIPISIKSDDDIPDVADDFCSPEDIKRIGMKLKKARRTEYFKLLLSLCFTLVSALLVMVIPEDRFDSLPFLPSLIQFGMLAVSALANINIFASFKNLFKKNTEAAAPIALSVSAMLIYMVYGLIFGVYPSEPALLTLISLAAFNYFGYKRATSVLNNFKIATYKNEKKAILLIDDQITASSMARTSIEGEVLAVGIKPTSNITDFIKFSSADSAFGGNLGFFTIVFGLICVVAAALIGISHESFDSAFSAIAIMLSFFAMPTFAIAEYLPLFDLSKALYKNGAMVCGKYSASRIEQANAVVITSADLFPEGSIELYNMKPLCSNNIDSTLSCAASVVEAANSPLASVFKTFVDPAKDRPVADSVNYEDNLGISGWVKDDHLLIGNRTLLEAHGVKVPPLEVDRKILHRGYFPVYVALGQRACAMLIVKYTPDRRVRNDLVRLINAGITLLVDNCDSNLTVEMLSDYYAIYPDSIRIMDGKGSHNYKNAAKYCESFSAHAVFVGPSSEYFKIISGSLKLRTVANFMYALHIVLAVLVSAVFTLSGINGHLSLLHVSICLLIEAVCVGASLLTYLIAKR